MKSKFYEEALLAEFTEGLKRPLNNDEEHFLSWMAERQAGEDQSKETTVCCK
ncbi:hypothetical protein [Alteribacillus iranensis]|uniref:Uncharacterized protein n=1 Tax=Alteribacillus iranensis TaxID=930128 RepID=A0A1I2ERP6_9BACI|nr:hypothetical protein [Alteribacillus iranensis]SFE95146.1 hypothetical protein SAMN05192532_106191 [Alteribacillus iranensis]